MLYRFALVAASIAKEKLEGVEDWTEYAQTQTKTDRQRQK